MIRIRISYTPDSPPLAQFIPKTSQRLSWMKNYNVQKSCTHCGQVTDVCANENESLLAVWWFGVEHVIVMGNRLQWNVKSNTTMFITVDAFEIEVQKWWQLCIGLNEFKSIGVSRVNWLKQITVYVLHFLREETERYCKNISLLISLNLSMHNGQ